MTSTPINLPFPSYKGNDPYVFICYAHVDSHVVYEDMKWLREEGVNLWYDEGINPGSHWHDAIAESIDKCSLFIVFMSAAAIESTYCKKEIAFALQHEKELLVIYLDEPVLPPGLSLAIGDLQAVMRNNLSKPDYRQKVLTYLTGQFEHPSSELIDSKFSPTLVRRPGHIVKTMVAVIFLIATFFYFYDDYMDRDQVDTISVDFDPRDWILLIVNNQTTNDLFDSSIEFALRIALQESKYVNLMSVSRVRDSLKRMGQEPASLGVESGLELALREDLAAVVESVVTQEGGAYILTTNILDPASKLTVFSHSENAETEDEVLPKLAVSAEIIRKVLGESEESIRTNKVELVRATTSNLNALRIYSNAVNNAFKGPIEETIEQLEQAVRLDPGFALAHSRIASYIWSVDGDINVAKYHWAEVNKHIDRLSQRERLIVNGASAWLESPEEMVRRWRLLTRMYPDDYGAHNNLGLVKWYFYNDFSGAEADMREVINIDPENGIAYHNLGYCLLALGETNAAWEAFQKATETTGFFTGLSDTQLALGNIDQAREPLKDFEYLTNPGDQIPRTTRLIGIEIIEGGLMTAYDLAVEGFRISEESNSAMSMIGFLGAQLAISERVKEYDFLTHLTLTQTQIEKLIEEERLWRFPTKEFALMGKLAARNGQLEKAQEMLLAIQTNSDHQGFPMAEDFENLLKGEIALANGAPEQALPLFEIIISRSNLFQAHESLARTHAAMGNSELLSKEINWLKGHLGQALSEMSDSMFGREMSLLDFREVSMKANTGI